MSMALLLPALSGGIKLIATGSNINTGDNANLPKPADVKEGDLAFIVATSFNPGAPGWDPDDTGGTGWSQILDTIGGGGTSIYQKLLGASEPAGWTFEHNNATSPDNSAVGLFFRRAAYDTIGVDAGVSGSGSLVMPGITMSKPGLLVAVVGSRDGSVDVSHSTPAGMELTAQQTNSSSYPLISVFTERVGAGLTGDRTCVVTNSTAGNSKGVLFDVVRA